METKSGSFKKRYKEEVEKGLKNFSPKGLLTLDDISHLPEPVKKYIEYTGAIGKEKTQNVRLRFTGGIKQRQGGKWLDFESEQYNFFDVLARLFYIKSKMFGLPFDGLHAYVGENATMEIKVVSLFKVVDAKGPEMNRGETVTMFNDMCLMAPASLIDKNIKWESIDSLTVKGTFTNQGNTISALLYFNEAGQLINFISDDRYLSSDGKTYLNYRWSTPAKDYIEINGRLVPHYGEAIWDTPEGPFCYGKFSLADIKYNLNQI